MFCNSCGFALEAEDLFCRRCGRATAAGEKVEVWVGPRLRRNSHDRRVAGVCGGFARYFEQDPKLIRILWTGASLLPFSPGLIVYVFCWAVLRRDDSAVERETPAKPATEVAQSS